MAEQIVRWENKKRARYYIAHAHVDLLGDRIVSCYWGGLHARLGGEQHQLVDSDLAAQALLADISKTRLQRGYEAR